jgi:hypothetical protein
MIAVLDTGGLTRRAIETDASDFAVPQMMNAFVAALLAAGAFRQPRPRKRAGWLRSLGLSPAPPWSRLWSVGDHCLLLQLHDPRGGNRSAAPARTARGPRAAARLGGTADQTRPDLAVLPGAEPHGAPPGAPRRGGLRAGRRDERGGDRLAGPEAGARGQPGVVGRGRRRGLLAARGGRRRGLRRWLGGRGGARLASVNAVLRAAALGLTACLALAGRLDPAGYVALLGGASRASTP